MSKYVVLIIEVVICIILYIVYFTNLDNPSFQDSIVVNIAKSLLITGLLIFIFLRIRNVAHKNRGFLRSQIIEAIYICLLTLVISFCLFDLYLLKERLYFNNHSSEFEQLVEIADRNGCVPSTSDYCEGYLSVPLEFQYWTGQEKMLVIKKSGNLYIGLGYKNGDGFFYMSDQQQPPQDLRISYFGISCSAKMLENWFVCVAYT